MRPYWIVAFGALLAALFTAMLPLAEPSRAQQPPAAAQIGGPFGLTDQDGQPVTEKDLLGKPSVIFFGFTLCPDICPTTLLEMTNWLKALGPDADKLNVFFVSVDPEDTPERMKLYLSSFDPHIRGLTGSEAQIQQIARAYNVYYRRFPLKEGGHTYDHSATVYALDKNGNHVGFLPNEAPPAVAAAGLRDLIAGKQ